jgi:protein archease
MRNLAAMHETFEHTADIGLRARAADLNSLFAEAAKAFFSVIVENAEEVRAVDEFSVTVEADERDDLLYDWLAELLYLFDTEHVLLGEFDVTVRDGGLNATVRGEPIDSTRHRLDMEVKAITYHELKVEQNGDEWLAEVIIDL